MVLTEIFKQTLIIYAGTLAIFLIGGTVILFQKANGSNNVKINNLTLANIEALSMLSPDDDDGTSIPCSSQTGEYCYFRVWDADGKYVSSNTWKNYVYASLDPTH